ncbi:MAG: NifB/NifX family molybdenum-iron cluster-binding protein [Deltaproteobacteria bacterium]|nr:NifB/NifX family molybdenum-iron cluster-binding protein [Deltaproteobacteria bacterium]
MKVALTVWENRISPVLDSASMLVVIDIRKGMIVNKHYVPFYVELPHARAALLADLGVRVLICGAMSQLYENLIQAYGIQIISFVTGDIENVLDAYLKGTLSRRTFQMPGIQPMRRRRFRGGRG